MNFSSLVGIVFALSVLWFGVIHPAPNPALFLDSHAIILVCGGTLAAALIAFPAKKLLNLLSFFLFGVLFKRKKSNQEVAQEVIVSHFYYSSHRLEQMQIQDCHPFLVEALSVLKSHNYTDQQLFDLLDTRIESIKQDYLADGKILNALAKFPPAFGLLGASTGMIVMMTNLGKGGAETIGPAMAIALVATFWGIAIANFVLLPLSDYATKTSQDDIRIRRMIADGIVAMNQRQSIKYLAEKVAGHLSIADRSTFKSFVKRRLISLPQSDYNEMVSQIYDITPRTRGQENHDAEQDSDVTRIDNQRKIS